jgi:hypothetical protein
MGKMTRNDRLDKVITRIKIKREMRKMIVKETRIALCRQRMNGSWSLKRTAVSVCSIDWEWDVERVLLPVILKAKCCRILVQGRRLPPDSEASQKGCIWPTMTEYQEQGVRNFLPMGSHHHVTCCLDDLVYWASFWWTHRSSKSLSWCKVNL